MIYIAEQHEIAIEMTTSKSDLITSWINVFISYHKTNIIQEKI